MTRLEKLLLLGILLLALFVRLYKLETPLADWHSWRQADTAAVTRRYTNEGINLLRPKYDDVSNIPSGKDNPQGYRMVEFPIINGFTAFLYQTIPLASQLEIHVFSRLISITFSLGSIIFLYLLVNLLSGKLEAIFTTLVFAILPYNVYYSRTILPEIPLVFFSLAALFFLTKWFLSKNHTLKSPSYWASIIAAGLALLLKPYAIFLILPILYLSIRECSDNLLKDKKSYLFLLLVFAPFILWRFWIQQFPEGIPAFMWLLNGNSIRFKGAFFRWIFAERIGKLILGYWGLILLGLGLIKKTNSKEGWFYHWWLIAILAYFTVFATGNVQHDYYQIISIPIISIFVAKGIAFLIKAPKKYNLSLITCLLLLVTSCTFAMAFSWFEIRGFYNINNPAIVEAGRVVDQLTKPDALVIAPYGGDTAFLYQTNRRGWPIGGEINDKIEKGARYYVSTSYDDETKELSKTYQVVEQTDKYTLIQLQD